VALLLPDIGPNLIDLDSGGQGSSRICSSISAAQPSPISTSKRQIVSRCVPVIRSVERIEFPSTKQLMLWTQRASGTRFMTIPRKLLENNACI
jgi:hypothetical protein